MVAITIAWLLSAGRADAQTIDAGAWTEATAVARAADRSPDVQAARFAVDVARAGSVFGRVPRVGNPILGARAMVGMPNADPFASLSLTFALPIDVSGQRRLFTREARWAVREAEARLDVVVNDARGRARASFVELASADAIILVSAGRVDGAREVLARVRAAVDRGAATAFDLALAGRELAEATADLWSAQRERDEAAGRFREAMDLTSASPTRVAPLGPPSLPPGMTREMSVRLAVAQRREGAVGSDGAQRLIVAADRMRAQYVAPLWITPEVALSHNPSFQTTTGVSVQWALPVLHTGQGERAVTQAQALAARAEGTRAARRADREAGTAWDVLASRLAELHTLEVEAIPALERTLQATERQLQLGATDFFRLLYARRELALMRRRATSAVREAWRARIALERAIGGTTALGRSPRAGDGS